MAQSPFDLASARVCDPENATNCTALAFTSTLPRVTVSAALKGIEKAQALRARMAKAHNKLELFLQQTEEELKGNETIHNFSTEVERREVFEAIEAAKVWLFEKADSATNANNFTIIHDGIKRMMAPILHRISESEAIQKVFAKFTETIDLVRYSIAVIWPQKEIVAGEDFTNLYQETVMWFQNARNAMTGLKPWEDAPFQAKDFEKRGRHLYKVLLKLNGPVKQPDPVEPVPVQNSL
jgi:hypothetical protein